MSKKIFVNLPVKDLEKSKEFFGALGYGFNPKFTNSDAACMVVSDDIFVMLLTQKFFKTFINKAIANAHKTTEVLVCLSEASREAVDAHLERALEAGATETREPQDHGFMYGRSFNDLDGHIWEIMWMDEAAANR
ncbi:MAG TPA: VOC family protein [Kiloniellales bacterium]